MFYLIVAVLLISYYFFMAPPSVKNTLSMIGLVGLVALLCVLAAAGFIKILQTPPEFFVSIAMIFLGFLALRDVLRLPAKKSKKNK